MACSKGSGAGCETSWRWIALQGNQVWKHGWSYPNRNSVVTVHYTGKTINGKKFDSSLGGVAPAFRLRDLIDGWIIALQHMHVGDKWEIYIPADKGYGKASQPGIPGGSTLIFEIELLGIA